MDRDQLFKLLDDFKIETPSWGYADTGTDRVAVLETILADVALDASIDLRLASVLVADSELFLRYRLD